MSETKNVIVLKALQDHLFSLKREDGNPIFKEVKILPWAFREPEEILNYGTNSNLFPAAYIIPGDDKTETGGVTNELRLTLFLLDKCYRQENNALESYSYLSRAVRSFASHENGELTDLGPGHINLLLASPENFPGDLVSITVSLAAYYS